MTHVARANGEAAGGVVEHLHIAPQAPMQAVTAARLVAGRGVLGDRYETGGGTFFDWPHDHEFTLVEAETIEDALAEYGAFSRPARPAATSPRAAWP